MAGHKGVRLAARETMQKNAYDPLEVLVGMAQETSVNSERKFEIAQILLPYMYPRLSNVTLDATVRDDTSDARTELMQKILSNPELADAASRLSIAAAESSLKSDEDTTWLQ